MVPGFLCSWSSLRLPARLLSTDVKRPSAAALLSKTPRAWWLRGVLAVQGWWAGAGSNRRPSAFQKEQPPCGGAVRRGWTVSEVCRWSSVVADVAVSVAVNRRTFDLVSSLSSVPGVLARSGPLGPIDEERSGLYASSYNSTSNGSTSMRRPSASRSSSAVSRHRTSFRHTQPLASTSSTHRPYRADRSRSARPRERREGWLRSRERAPGGL
jgi:hypothetical protein